MKAVTPSGPDKAVPCTKSPEKVGETLSQGFSYNPPFIEVFV